ncbi:transcription factor E4F1 isoform X3 [Ochotona curzoniae]|uniref:transcription factor E4F1 isoform X3 n=1 Tax=Ochotona curzoniae TaxID=130825 RepID=UPI001B34BEBA|nr:transcription factor E4F1 isoform X3 [Ochotona curzoniae]XP_040853441.1 transcription factor E4F1 isoform X3 [Ochotona curzoniae]
MEGAMAVRVTAAHTAAARAEAGREVGEGGVAAAEALAPGGFLGLPAPFSEEDEDDVHRCGRCQAEFTALEDFVQHKIQKVCQRAPQEALPAGPAAAALLGQEVVPAAAGPEEPVTVAHIVVEAADIRHAPDLVGGEHIKEVIVAAAEPGDTEVAEAPGSLSRQGLGLTGEGEQAPVRLLVDKDGRYVCMLCHKTFKTGSILKAHMVTHSSRKDHECKLCGASFRTKGSLIRHHRRHTDERPYKCAKCGKSFRESGALTRHLKSLTPCTEKIRFSMGKDTAVSSEDTHAGQHRGPRGLVRASSAGTEEPMETSPVIHLVTDAKGTVIHEVHVQMQELPLGMKALAPEPSAPEELPCSGEGSRENLLHQFCSRGFREKGSLVRHVRHHTGEKPFKCYKCGRGFAEHGTLNRHLRTKGGCLLEVEELLVSQESPAAATVLAEDPHTVLVEFSSVVADTQEYIIEATGDDAETSEAAEIIEGAQTEVDSHIMKVVQQIVHQASAGHQIIVQNVSVDQEAGLGPDAAATDTITIATPESLTEQVAMTLASAISEGTVLAARTGATGSEQATVTMVSSEDIEILEHGGELVIASPEGQLEVQTVIV